MIEWAGANPRVRWDKSWKAMSRVFQEERKRRKHRALSPLEAQEELKLIMNQLITQHDPELIRQMIALEAEIKARQT